MKKKLLVLAVASLLATGCSDIGSSANIQENSNNSDADSSIVQRSENNSSENVKNSSNENKSSKNNGEASVAQSNSNNYASASSNNAGSSNNVASSNGNVSSSNNVNSSNNGGSSSEIPDEVVVDLADEQAYSEFTEKMQGGLVNAMASMMVNGVSIDSSLYGEFSDECYENEELVAELNISDLYVSNATDLYLNAAKMSEKDYENAIEMVGETRFDGNVYSMELMYPMPKSGNRYLDPLTVEQSFVMEDLGLNYEMVDGVIYLDMSDRSIINFVVDNYVDLFDMLNRLTRGQIPSSVGLDYMFGGPAIPVIEGGQPRIAPEEETEEEYNDTQLALMGMWEMFGLDKTYISLEELEARYAGSTQPVLQSGPRVPNPSSPNNLPMLLGYLSAAMAVAPTVEGLLEYTMYKDGTSSLVVDINNENYIEFFTKIAYFARTSTLEGYNLEYYLPDEGDNPVQNLELNMYIEFDNLNRPCAIEGSFGYEAISELTYDDEYGEVLRLEGEEMEEEEEAFGTERAYLDFGFGAAIDYTGRKAVPAEEHEDYVNLLTIIDMMMPLSEDDMLR